MSEARTDPDDIDFVPWEIPNFDADDGLGSTNSGSLAERSEAVLKGAFAEGFESGRREGIESAKQETSGQVSQFVEVLDSLSRYAREFDQQIARDLVALSGKIAEQVILKELSLAPELMLALVEKIIESLPKEDLTVSIYLHPHDATAFNEHLTGTLHQHWKIIEDTELNRGDCRIESTNSIINNKLDQQINTILTALLEQSANHQNTT